MAVKTPAATEDVAQKESPLTPRLTEEVRAALSAPLDPKFLRQRKGQGGKMFTYADIDYLERRASEVDPDWGAPAGLSMFVVTDYSVVCNITICSVPRSATAGYYIPAEYDVWDNNQKQMVSRKMTAEVAHTIVTRAQAAAERRVFAMFELGAELWAHNESEYEADRAAQDNGSKPRGGQTGSGGYKEPSPAALKMLTDLGVPESIARNLNAWGRGKDPNTGYPMSDASEVIDALKKARGGSKGAVDRRTWEPIVSRYVSTTTTQGSADDDDDWASAS